MRPRLQRTALPKLLAHPAYRRDTKTEKLGNLASALAAFIELKNALTHGDRYGSHGHILCHTIAILKSYIIYGNALMAPKLNRRRAVFVLSKIDEILAWEKATDRERDSKFVEL